MKKKSLKKLTLNRESLRVLDSGKLQDVVGGTVGITGCNTCSCALSCIGTCMTCGCPDTGGPLPETGSQ